MGTLHHTGVNSGNTNQLHDDLMQVRKSIMLLLQHLLLPLAKKLDTISGAIASEVKLYRQAQYRESHQAEINSAHDALLKKAKFAMRANRQQ